MADRPVYSQGGALDVLLSLSWEDYKKFPGELDVKPGVIVVTDEKEVPEPLPLNGGLKAGEVFKIPFDELVKESGNPKAKNIIALGVLAELFNLPADSLKKSIQTKFGKKKQEILEANLKALDIGINYAKGQKLGSQLKFEYKTGKQLCVANGNDTIAFGALTAGCRFFASYPITPASEIMEWMGRELPKFGGTMVQAEDEISAACMVTGAGFGGVKAMTATSGPGVSLKIETLGLGSITEIPYVLVNVQRGGPATGIPTKSEQADLMQAVYGMHGDAPHAVLAPADVEDCFEVAIRAFNTAEAYQMPVIILSDQFIGHRKETLPPFDVNKVKIVNRKTPKNPKRGEYKRYELTDDGVSPMSYPGIEGGEYTCAGIEHNEAGNPASSHDIHERMSAKRELKLSRLAKEYKFIRRYGAEKPDIGILAWGSTKGVVREAVEIANAKGKKVAALVPQLMFPLQTELIDQFVRSCKKVMIVEMSFSGQFRHYLSSYVKLPEDIIHVKASGATMFGVNDILNKLL
jgi:2-oxoglutarate ferredoxin oxidoreductase subunit alpha